MAKKKANEKELVIETDEKILNVIQPAAELEISELETIHNEIIEEVKNIEVVTEVEVVIPEPVKVVEVLSAKDMFFKSIEGHKHYEISFRNKKVYDTINDTVQPVPMDDVLLIGNIYFPYAGLTVNIK